MLEVRGGVWITVLAVVECEIREVLDILLELSRSRC